MSMMTDLEFRLAAKLHAHEQVMKNGGPGAQSMGEMVNVGVDVGVDFERFRICSVLRSRGLLSLAAEVEEGIR
jgi:hypothetical protein